LKIAFVLGNGTSRKDIPLDFLKNYGTVYGCNAIYRDYDPHYIIAVDAKMVMELNRHKVQHKISVWTNPNKAYASLQGLNFFNPSKGWSSGPTALWKASEDNNQKIYILGFDYKGLGEQNQNVNNVYAGTENYKRKNDRATFYGNWLKQTAATIKKNPQKRYIRVLEERGFIPKEFANLENLEHISVAKFIEMYGK
jgi:hypothetical protein